MLACGVPLCALLNFPVVMGCNAVFSSKHCVGGDLGVTGKKYVLGSLILQPNFSSENDSVNAGFTVDEIILCVYI